MDSRNITHPSPYFPVPVLRRSRCLPTERQSHNFQVGVVVGRPLYGSVRMYHTHAGFST